MNYEQVQLVDETVRQVRHALSNLLVSTGLVIERFDTLSIEKKAKFEHEWHVVYLQAIQDLQATQVVFDAAVRDCQALNRESAHSEEGKE